MYYLEMEYGFDKFKQIYEVIKATDSQQSGEINIDEYLEKLEGVVEPERILRNLFLFLSLSRTEDQATGISAN